jgi:phosphate-selective porin OprO and OprP
MKLKLKFISLAAAGLIASQANAGTVTTDGADIILKTKGGFEARTTDGNYSFKIGGRMQLDYNHYDGVTNAGATTPGDTGNDFFFRRARIEIKGHANDWKYGLSYNLTDSGSIVQLNTTFTGFGKMAQFTAGQQTENFGLEDSGSSKWITAVERSLVANAFDTGNNLGLKLHGANDFLTYSLGVFKEGIDSDRDIDGAVTGRVVVRPIYVDGNVLHIGVGATHRSGDGSSDTGFDDFESRLGVRGGSDGKATKYAPQFTTGDGDRSTAYNLELAYAAGPMHFMAEYYTGEVDAPEAVAASDDLEVNGAYLQAGYILTGESRSYKTGSAAFDKVSPQGANGAWEIFARYDIMNADTGTNIKLTGGEDAEVTTLGVNYYMNANVKMAVNYVTAETDTKIGGKDDGDAIVARLQFAF